jgi:hypothetical protein
LGSEKKGNKFIKEKNEERKIEEKVIAYNFRHKKTGT